MCEGKADNPHDNNDACIATTQRTFIQMGTILKAMDNSGAKEVMCIQSPKGHKGARLCDIIVGSVKEAIPRGKVQKEKVVYGLVVRAAMRKGRLRFHRFRLLKNWCTVGLYEPLLSRLCESKLAFTL